MTYKSKNIHMCNSEIIWGRPTDGLMDMTSFRDAWPKICIPPIFYFCFSNGQTERHTILLRWENENWSWLILISDLSRGALYGWKFILQRCLTFFNRQRNKDCFDAIAEVYVSPFFFCLWLDFISIHIVCLLWRKWVATEKNHKKYTASKCEYKQI